MLKRLIAKVSNKKDLNIDEAKNALELCTSTDTSIAQIAALLTALKMKGETIDELTGFATAMRSAATTIEYNKNPTYDCCGTGGDMASTINISTTAGILAAAAGVYIVKHSNKSITSMSGSSDVLQELKINLCNKPEEAINCLDKTNIAFLHAPSFHQSTSNVAILRKDIGLRTIFNLLGPLTNPATPTGQIIGVSSPELCPVMIEVLRNLKLKRAMVVCSPMPRLDEISISGPTIIYELNNKKITNYEITPEQFGLTRVHISKIKGSTPQNNAQIATEIFNNKITDARKDIIALNCAAVLLISGKVESFQEGLNVSIKTIESKKASDKLLQLQNINL